MCLLFNVCFLAVIDAGIRRLFSIFGELTGFYINPPYNIHYICHGALIAQQGYIVVKHNFDGVHSGIPATLIGYKYCQE